MRMVILTKPLFLFLIGICLFLSIYVKEKKPLNIILPIFFSFLLLIEITCYYLKGKDINNLIIYNLWFPIEFIAYSYWIIFYFNSGFLKKIWSFLIPFYALSVIIIYFFANDLFKFNTLTFQLGFILLLPVILLKLYEYTNDNVISNPLKVPMFWLIIGLLISYIFSLTEFSILNYLHLNNINLLEGLKKVNIIVTDVLYISIIVYFVLKWKNKKSHISFSL